MSTRSISTAAVLLLGSALLGPAWSQAAPPEPTSAELRQRLATMRTQLEANRKSLEKADSSGGDRRTLDALSGFTTFARDAADTKASEPKAATPAASGASSALKIIKEREDRELGRERTILLDELLRQQILKK